MLTWEKLIPNLRIENLKNSTLSSGTYLYCQYMGVSPTPDLAPPWNCVKTQVFSVTSEKDISIAHHCLMDSSGTVFISFDCSLC